MARLLCEYKDVFSSGDHDIGLASAVRQEIPLAAGTTPIRQPTRRLGPEKEKEVSRQVQDLLNRDPIEPAHSAWSSPSFWSRERRQLAVLCGLSQIEQRNHTGRLPSLSD